MAPRLHTIICSTRPGRHGPKVANWFHGVAAAYDGFESVLVDLADFALPLFDEPKHPRLHQYEHAHTRRWSESVASADAFAFVTPEYNYFAPPAFVNAITYLSQEWAYKPAGFVSYGGVSGGLRAQQSEKQLLTTLKMMPIPESVSLPAFSQHIQPDGSFEPGERAEAAARAMLDELHRWAVALQPMRTQG